jgi:hypothetical protein
MSGTEERTVKSLSELSPAIEPGRDLWPGIAARLGESASAPAAQPQPLARARLAQLRWLAAAAMLASVAVGVWIGRDVLPLPGAPTVPVATTPPTQLSQGAAVDAAYVSDPRYVRQRAELMQSVQARLAAMPEPARAKVAASLAAIETAKKDLEGALGKDPGNALLQELLINTYQDEMRVLTDVHETGDPSRGI